MKKRNRLVGVGKADEKAEKRLHSFLHAWNGYIRRQIGLHRRIDKGRESLNRHVKETIRMTEAFAKKLRKLK